MPTLACVPLDPSLVRVWCVATIFTCPRSVCEAWGGSFFTCQKVTRSNRVASIFLFVGSILQVAVSGWLLIQENWWSFLNLFFNFHILLIFLNNWFLSLILILRIQNILALLRLFDSNLGDTFFLTMCRCWLCWQLIVIFFFRHFDLIIFDYLNL